MPAVLPDLKGHPRSHRLYAKTIAESALRRHGDTPLTQTSDEFPTFTRHERALLVTTYAGDSSSEMRLVEREPLGIMIDANAKDAATLWKIRNGLDRGDDSIALDETPLGTYVRLVLVRP